MLHLEFHCPACEFDYEIELTVKGKPFDFKSLTCSECQHKGLVLVSAEVASDPAIRLAHADFEKRVSAIESYLADHTADSDEPFEAGDLN